MRVDSLILTHILMTYTEMHICDCDTVILVYFSISLKVQLISSRTRIGYRDSANPKGCRQEALCGRVPGRHRCC